MRRIARLSAALGSAVLVSFLLTGLVSAHVVKTFGTYTVALGWVHEPTYVGEENAVQAVVKDAKGNPVADLNAGDLTVTVSIGGQTSDPIPLVPTLDPDTGLGTPGDYEGPIVPTVVGDYTFHMTGSIHGTAVDETATSSDATFDSGSVTLSIEFPNKLPAISDLSTKVDAVDGRASSANTTATNAQNSANTALTAGVVVGGLGVVLGLIGIGLTLRRPARPKA